MREKTINRVFSQFSKMIKICKRKKIDELEIDLNNLTI